MPVRYIEQQYSGLPETQVGERGGDTTWEERKLKSDHCGYTYLLTEVLILP